LLGCQTKSLITYDPTPSRALNGSSGSVKLLFHVFNVAESSIDGIFERTRLDLATGTLALACGWCEVLPEERVVDVA